MSINETNLRRTIRKEGELSKKLVAVRKRRDDEAKKINTITKKKNVTRSDLQRLERYQKNLLKYEKEMTQLMEQIRKNNDDINRNKEKVDKEQKREYEKMMKTIKSQTNTNENYMNKVSEISERLNELAIDVKHTAHEKEIIEYDVFLSHSSLDKETFVTELSEKLSNKGLNVFEDVKVFKIGQSQTDMMNMGILNSRFVVVFLSSNFIQSGWSEYEFKSFLNREINEKKIIILPIWHDVSVEQVRQYNPYLVDKFALSTDKFTVDEMVEHISQVISQSKE
ncbi:toll/interleukin-1 receptor domain-containing protein [Cerasibacillus terrae]|uniref:ADP-ribosyl cyclase/cyclic ADP-ribose hydrolase n=1 Tax=Cerasibacillus terrae TaxID=2498845 RepID=A0A5C8NIQ1_9BACI|nr:toll/interleukin-1 receptor domain-containing protein [Cerasibacillus terrae]TXL61102.1 toll/interleukin-1 receptor domain-containing protein [Cerasibacillus terrae]